ncbi:hypothetical protein [Myceligenerans pegani]|uniref:DUF3618 domain-containing protein n=1 Tax=Myceligenerans pegani TaxID=2776917 RepID=A0ABR9N3K3_9MICO|nr:hypothetical protein [Myceligenerans sp. TRM 65318]MBE1877704.1 hypothetical protein [Myceligenerans sp. TRM 65318]MBE3019975.1 hypothetical protein [Myceligenerans sp. TRM 65318]
MSETGTPYEGGSGSRSTSPSGNDTSRTGTGPTGVRERVTDTAAEAADAGRTMTEDVKEKARDVAHETTAQARGLLDRTRSELDSQARSQQQWVADSLHAMEDELGRMASASRDPGYATDLVRRAGDATGQAARWLEDREPRAILGEIEDFARRRPGVFIALAAGAGLVVGRFLRGMKDASGTGEGHEPAAVNAPAGRPAPASAPAGETTGTVPTAPAVPGDASPDEPPAPTSSESTVRPTIPPPVPPPAPGTQAGGGTHA